MNTLVENTIIDVWEGSACLLIETIALFPWKHQLSFSRNFTNCLNIVTEHSVQYDRYSIEIGFDLNDWIQICQLVLAQVIWGLHDSITVWLENWNN